MNKLLSSIFELLKFSWELLVDFHEFGFALISSSKYSEKLGIVVPLLFGGILILICITLYYIIIFYFTFEKIKIKLHSPKIKRIESTGVIIEKHFQPDKKVYYNDTKNFKIFPPQYNVIIISNGIKKTFNNKKLYFSNKKIVNVIIVKKIYKSKVEIDLELPE